MAARDDWKGRRLSEDGVYHLATVRVPLGYTRHGGEIERVPVKQPGAQSRVRKGQRAKRVSLKVRLSGSWVAPNRK